MFYIHLFDKYLLSAYHVPGTLLVAKYTLVNKSVPVPVWVRAPEGNRWHIQRIILKSLMKEGNWVGTEALAREL